MNNNFDFLRLLFAMFVIITHSYPLSGDKGWDCLGEITNGNLQFSYIGVKGFFVISGYLIFQSLLRSRNWVGYFWKRILRLFPGLLVVLVLTILLAPFVYESPMFYLENRKVYTYIIRNITLFQLQYSIPGVFDTNIYGSAINGSLWTICYEFFMYFLLSFLILFRSQKKLLGLLLWLVFGVFFVYHFFLSTSFPLHIYDLRSSHLSELGLFFLGGSLLAFLNYRVFPYLKTILVLSGVLIICSEVLVQDPFIFRILFWPVFIIGIGEHVTPVLSQIGSKVGDLSYGIYIYGFPIQQTLMHYFKFNALELMLVSLPISMLFGYWSWHVIEKKMLRYKNI
ncbi:acyltransferase family protein [Flavobacterium sp. RSSA_27]|uniref:acyltransferase family protein n=1 Tax=Flavobacterium sp. RSSA_27 TaxID=3447667 RepID=UPI003F34836B